MVKTSSIILFFILCIWNVESKIFDDVMYADDNNFEYGFCLIFAFLLCDNLLNVLHNYCFLGFTFRPLSNILLILVLSFTQFSVNWTFTNLLQHLNNSSYYYHIVIERVLPDFFLFMSNVQFIVCFYLYTNITRVLYEVYFYFIFLYQESHFAFDFFV